MTESNLVRLPTAEIEQGAIEQVLGYGDLTKLTPTQRTAYYTRVCESLGLNPLTRPFEFINLSGKLVFYARRDCTDQLRKIHAVSITIVSRERVDDCYVVTARASFPDGRTDESIGAVPLGANVKGEALANALMKAETKAKRRVTLAICGLSVLDETELDGARDRERQDTIPVERQLGAINPHDQEGDSANGEPEVYERLRGELAAVDISLEACDTYQKLLTLRAVVGNKDGRQPTPWQQQYKAAQDSMNGAQRKEIGRLWNRCDRQLAKLEEKLKPDAAESFIDPPDDDPDNYDRNA
jgi:hypothetical protein